MLCLTFPHVLFVSSIEVCAKIFFITLRKGRTEREMEVRREKGGRQRERKRERKRGERERARERESAHIDAQMHVICVLCRPEGKIDFLFLPHLPHETWDQIKGVSFGGKCLYLPSYSSVLCIPVLVTQGNDIRKFWAMKIDLFWVLLFLPL